jgi:hypothetical protein
MILTPRLTTGCTSGSHLLVSAAVTRGAEQVKQGHTTAASLTASTDG